MVGLLARDEGWRGRYLSEWVRVGYGDGDVRDARGKEEEEEEEISVYIMVMFEEIKGLGVIYCTYQSSALVGERGTYVAEEGRGDKSLVLSSSMDGKNGLGILKSPQWAQLAYVSAYGDICGLSPYQNNSR